MKEYNINYFKAVAVLVNKRKTMNISQRNLCSRIGVGLNTFMKFESDDTYINFELLEQYANSLGLQITLNVLDAGS